MLVSNDANVRQATEEYERSKLELLFNGSRLEASKQVARARAFEGDPSRLKNAPNKSGTIKPVWSSCSPAITRSEALIDSGHQEWLKLDKSGARRTNRRRKVNRRFWFCTPNRL